MTDKLANYQRLETPLPPTHRLLPLYEAGFENLGRDGKPVEAPLPAYGLDELLVRHDACSLCFSDIKVIKVGGAHPRISGRDLTRQPVVLGHELSITVVGVGANLRDRFKEGQRYILQPDIFFHGRNVAYGYVLQGGLSQYAVLGDEVLRGDGGCYLLPVLEKTGYAEAALTEPWACVNAAYHLDYRTGLQPGGTTWVIGTPGQANREYRLSRGLEPSSHPASIILSDVPSSLAEWLKRKAGELGISITERNGLEVQSIARLRDEIPPPGVDRVPPPGVDDVILLGPAPAGLIDAAAGLLKWRGILNLVTDQPLPELAPVDVGRLHYDYITYIGSPGPDISASYTPVRASLRQGGNLWVLGASGPMGHMHVQRAIEMVPHPHSIVATNLSSPRINEVTAKFASAAQEHGITLTCLTEAALGRTEFDRQLKVLTGGKGFDDIMVLAPDIQTIQYAATHLAPGGVMNLFVGLSRGTTAAFDLNAVCDPRQVRFIGNTGSSINDLKSMLELTENGQLATNYSVAAIAGLDGAADGLRALQEGRFPGKVVVYPLISGLGLTPLEELHSRLPGVAALLENGHTWTNAAEKELLRELL
jgi:NADPH:quinone reductase-like Zn-dependent oxidoreductase